MMFRILLDGHTVDDLPRCRYVGVFTHRRCDRRREFNRTTCNLHRDKGRFDDGACETRLGALCSQLLVGYAERGET